MEICCSVYPLSKHTHMQNFPLVHSQQIMLHNAVEKPTPISGSFRKALPLFPPFCRPLQSAGGEWSCVASLERVSYLVLSPRLCLGSDLCVCVCVVHNGCVYIGFGVNMFIHARTFIRTCRLCFLFSRERGVVFFVSCLQAYQIDTIFDKVVAWCLARITTLTWDGLLILQIYFFVSCLITFLFFQSFFNQSVQ